MLKYMVHCAHGGFHASSTLEALPCLWLRVRLLQPASGEVISISCPLCSEWVWGWSHVIISWGFRGLSNQWRVLYKPSEKPGCMRQRSMHIRHQERTRNKNYSHRHETTRQWISIKWKTDPDLVLERWQFAGWNWQYQLWHECDWNTAT